MPMTMGVRHARNPGIIDASMEPRASTRGNDDDGSHEPANLTAASMEPRVSTRGNNMHMMA